MENLSPQPASSSPSPPAPLLPRCCTIRFRLGDQPVAAVSRIIDLRRDEVVMLQTDHGLEPGVVIGQIPAERPDLDQPQDHQAEGESPRPAQNHKAQNHKDGGEQKKEKSPPRITPTVIRRASPEEQEKYRSLLQREREDFLLAQQLISKHQLPMKLIRAERFFSGGKIIFYFTAENRVDFRGLVKDMVQEFRTRVEIRQVGVRHETKMIGGLGCCGRELCCSSYINQFAPVSIKMAKEQGLPLNPAKISGICNRLLCCLTYEFETYQKMRRIMPKAGKMVTLDGRRFKVLKLNILEENVEVCDLEEPERVIIWQASEWRRCEPAKVSGKPGADQAAADKGGERKKGERSRRQPPPDSARKKSKSGTEQ
ncbi:PSP1 domain-containing protein [Desulfurivibrio alkaliphilus]|uniref:PSP1 domain protein n=1 Tax=Desulfurivibrio alkaliphilus (strain DSM 19089 / UNIQEM U267 / AHT2) TaxID=589865 RepID=D6Z4U1_DESAT|nr:regulatory iron-sulfur-containing complex subunit RicT [Desulfurivibrio alkaliphilus]ADH86566.1 PSP1 domain protein [Desulfurivibrio alkaliphilus AHT 2]